MKILLVCFFRGRLPAAALPAFCAVLAAALGGGCSYFRPMPESIPLYHAAAAAGELLAGAAAVEITPAENLWMGGYGILRTSAGVHDPLYARAVAMRRGDLEIGLVEVDVVGLQRQDILRIQEKMAGVDPRHIIIASTHNHSAPDTLGLWGLPPLISGVDGDYLDLVEEGILEAWQRARASLRPAEVGYGAVKAEAGGFIKNLRLPGIVDSEVVVLHLREPGRGRTIATVVELGCHPEVLGRDNRLITADFPHWTNARLEKELGGTAVYVSGALGALVTPDVKHSHPTDPQQEWAEAERIGNRLAGHALEAIRGITSYDRVPGIAIWHAPIFLPNRNFRFELVRWTGIIDRDRYRWGYYLTEVNLWKIGQFRLASVPGEVAPSLGLRIKRAAGGRPAMIAGLANDELGYILPMLEYGMPIYSYERTLCPGYDSGELLLQRLEDLGMLAE